MTPAQHLHSLGAWLLPVNGKRPLNEAWQAERFDASGDLPGGATHWGWIPATVGLLVIDIDEGDANELTKGWAADSWLIVPTRKGWHVIVSWPAGWGDVRNAKWSKGDAAGDIRHAHGFCVAWDIDAVRNAVTMPPVADNRIRQAVGGMIDGRIDEADKADALLAGVAPGRRNITLFKSVLRAPGKAAEWAQAAAAAGLSAAEIDATVRSALSRAKKLNGAIRNIEWSLDPQSRDSWAAQCPLPFRYVDGAGQWYYLEDDAGWQKLRPSQVRDRLRAWAWSVAEALASDDPDSLTKVARGFDRADAARVAGAVADASWCSTDAEDIDADPNLCGLPNGDLIDLRTGDTRAVTEADGVYRQLGTVPSDMEPKRWLAFLRHCLPDAAERRWLRAWMLYSISGHTGAELTAFLTGTPGAGKSTIVRVLQQVSGDYNGITNADNVVRGEQHPTWLIDIATARCATIEEVPDGRWSHHLKSLISGDKITARRMRGEWADFKPTCKLTMTSNTEPTSAAGDGIIRRLAIVRCVNPPDVPDPNLLDALRAEAPGILSWMIGADLADVRKLPQSVLAERADYTAESDELGALIDVVLRRADGPFVTYDALTDALRMAGFNDDLPTKRLNMTLKNKGFTVGRANGKWRVREAALQGGGGAATEAPF